MKLFTKVVEMFLNKDVFVSESVQPRKRNVENEILSNIQQEKKIKLNESENITRHANGGNLLIEPETPREKKGTFCAKRSKTGRLMNYILQF